jgi:hypothetical protein
MINELGETSGGLRRMDPLFFFSSLSGIAHITSQEKGYHDSLRCHYYIILITVDNHLVSGTGVLSFFNRSGIFVFRKGMTDMAIISHRTYQHQQHISGFFWI